MPKAIPDIEGFKFFFWSNERSEPIHVHVFKAGANAKFWLEPQIRLAWNRGFKSTQLRRILNVLTNQRYAIQEAWRSHFQA